MKRHAKTLAAAVALAALFAPTAQAACMSDLEAAALVASYMARTPAANPEGLSTEDGECSRTKVNRFLAQQIGAKVVGYKAGLTNPAVQKRFNASAPVWGVLYAPMLLKDGATVDAKFGARPLFEADMLVRVSDAAINKARTPEQVLRHIDQVIPFMELPDLVVQAPPKLNGAAIAAINVGARLGVLGAPIAVQRTAAFSDALRDMVVIVKGDGTELDKGKGSDVLEHPLNAVVWLVQDLSKNGLALKKGDLVSLGSFSKLLPPKPGLAVEVVYQGLPGNPVVRASFH
ncbi:MAG: fumarylacetoacetate hydrolase [Rhizobacter sp.]|nr:fumarylacetoacetate hydrolase [Rhizobacter sp.]